MRIGLWGDMTAGLPGKSLLIAPQIGAR
jgi:hypothetical protein